MKGRYWPISISVMMMMVNSHLSPLSLHADRESLSWPQWLAKKALCLSAGGENNVPFTAHQSRICAERTQDESHFPKKLSQNTSTQVWGHTTLFSGVKHPNRHFFVNAGSFHHQSDQKRWKMLYPEFRYTAWPSLTNVVHNIHFNNRFASDYTKVGLPLWSVLAAFLSCSCFGDLCVFVCAAFCFGLSFAGLDVIS